MIECIFTIDYEIYGNGQGSLRGLVHEPARRLMSVFEEWNVRFVNFVEVAELQKIEECRTDEAIADVRCQVREMFERGFEIALHLHPQWCNAVFQNGSWLLDYTEYNLCRLPRKRIVEIVEGALAYLRNLIGVGNYTPSSFRAGNWLLQPSSVAAAVLAEKGIRIDSSVFKGGLQHSHGLDYRPAMRNGYYWTFADNASLADPRGQLLEIPIHTEMVPFWRMLTTKRLRLQRKSNAAVQKVKGGRKSQRWSRIRDHLRFRYPLKFDFCRMTLEELTNTVERIIRLDEKSPGSFKPLVAIGHTKDLNDFETIRRFLAYLRNKRIRVSTLQESYDNCEHSLSHGEHGSCKSDGWLQQENRSV
jgi:hypothetical protein